MKEKGTSPSRSERLYRRLLRLYPPAFRESYGELMAEAFRHRLDKDSPAGLAGWIRFWAGITGDLARSLGEQRRAWRRESRRSARATDLAWKLSAPAGGLAADLALALRLALRHPRVSLAAVAAMTAGISAAAFAYGIHYGTFVRGLAVQHPDRMVHIDSSLPSRGQPRLDMTLRDFQALAGSTTTLEEMAAYHSTSINLSGSGVAPELLEGVEASAALFRLLETPPLHGRALLDSDQGPAAPLVLVLSHSLWMRRFEGDPGIVGRTVTAAGSSATVAGIMPEGFRFPGVEEVWLPLRIGGEGDESLGHRYDVLGKLRAGATLGQAQAEAQTVARRLQAARPESNQGVGFNVRPFAQSYRSAAMDSQDRLILWSGALILLIACANAASLLLVRACGRGQELAVRTALGAGRARLLRQFVLECAPLAIASAGMGGLLAHAALLWYQTQWRRGFVWWVYGMDAHQWLAVVGLAAGICLTAALPALLHGSRAPVGDALRDGSRYRPGRRFGFARGIFVASQVALGGALLFIASLMVKSALNLRTIDWGFAVDNVVTGRIALDSRPYMRRQARDEFWRRLLHSARQIPGVQEATLASQLPMIRRGGRTPFALQGEEYSEDQYPFCYRDVVSPEFFATFDKAVLQGRGFQPSDGPESEPVAIVNQDFASRFLAGGSVLGRRIRLGGPDSNQPWRTVVGIAPHLWMDSDVNALPEGIYVPQAQEDRHSLSLALRVRGDPSDFVKPLRQALYELDPQLALFEAMTMPEVIRMRTTAYRRTGPLFMIFGAAALLLAVIGLYGVTSYATGQRTAEIGVRMALGADRRRVLALILGQGIPQVAAGIGLGTGLALYLSAGLHRFIFELEPWDPAVLASSFAVLGLTALWAILIPARRATRIDPACALRSQ